MRNTDPPAGRNGLIAPLLLSITALAHGAGSGRGEVPPPPPPEALQACQSLGQGADCEFTTPRGTTIKGSCWAPEGRPLACKPKEVQGQGAKGMPGQEGPQGKR